MLKKERLQLINLLEFEGLPPTPRLGQDARRRVGQLKKALEQAETPAERLRRLQELGVACFEADNLDEAEEAFSRALAQSEHPGDNRAAVAALDSLSRVALARGHKDEAWRRLQKALSILMGEEDKPGLADMHLRMGAVSFTLGRWGEAEHHYGQSAQLGEMLNDRSRQVVACDALSRIYRARGKRDLEHQALQQTLDLYTKLGDQRERARVIAACAQVELEAGNTVRAEELAEESLFMLKNDGELTEWALQVARLGNFYMELGRQKTLRDLLKRAADILRERGHMEGAAAISRVSGDLEARNGQVDKALKYYHSARRRFIQTGSQRGVAMSEIRAGLLEESCEHYQWAREHYSAALPRFRKLGELTGMAETLRGLGRLSRRAGRPSQAADYFQQALDLDRKVGNPALMVRGAMCLSETLAFRHKHEKALELAQEILVWAARLDAETHAEALVHMAELQKQAGDAAQYADYLGKARGLYQTFDPGRAAEIQEGMARQAELEGTDS